MSPQIIKIKYQNGLTADICENDILVSLKPRFTFVENDQPDFVLFGPYGNDIPLPGNYVRIGYFCENFKPDMSICEWAFGMLREEEVNHPRYKKIQWHGLKPRDLIKPPNYNAAEIAGRKTKFCNFLYAHSVPYREDFFKLLSKYKKIDAPGKSMNNMPGIDQAFTGDKWGRKRKFLTEYKFTIAFENYVYPGYQTEKLYDPMLADSIPVYCGDPFVGELFNTAGFLNAADYVQGIDATWIRQLEKLGQPDFNDLRPAFYNTPFDRIKRKLKTTARESKMRYQFPAPKLQSLVDRLVELDQDPDKYVKMLTEPWLKNNALPETAATKNRWIKIFSQGKAV